MTTQCIKCSAQIEPQWAFCPLCGVANPNAKPLAAEPRKHEPSPVRNAFGGLFFGLIVAPVFIIVGGMLCLTGLGAFLGIPLIIAGILAPLLGPILGFNEIKGNCPWCGTKIASIINHSQDFPCPNCGKEIAIHNKELEKAA
jgi:predicted RNA-binding Zn-ribbon protein involved in translation (DUF1610 family)